MAARSTPALLATTDDGVRLALERFAPAGPRRAVALLTHAMMARGAYLARFAEELARHGVESYVLDFRGHGKSVPPRARRGPGWCFDDLVRRDLPAAVTAVSNATGVTPAELAYVGHSLGGLAGLAAFGSGEVPAPRRLVLVAVNVWTRPRGVRLLASVAFVTSARIAGHVPARRLRFGSDDEPRGYVDQFTSWLWRGFSTRDGSDYRALLPRVTSPTLALVGEGDWMCRPADTRAFLAQVPSLRTRCIGRVHGDALDPNHFQLLTDSRLRSVWHDTAEFVVS